MRITRRRTGAIALALSLAGALGASCTSSSGGDGAGTPAATSPAATGSPVDGGWRVVADPALSAEGPDLNLSDAGVVHDADGGTVGVIIGSRRSEGTAPRRPFLATSDDGRAWEEADLTGDDEDGTSISDVAGSTDAGVAVGGNVRDGRLRPRLWTTADATTWDREDVDLGDLDQAMLSGVAPTRRGFVAVGFGEQDGRRRIVTLTGEPGDWQPLASLEGSDEQTSIRAITAGGSSVVLVGSQEGPAGSTIRAWVSTDGGATWAQSADDAFGPPSAARASTVTWVDSAFIAVGTATDGTATAWRSRDGLTWTNEPIVGRDGKPLPVLPSSATAIDDVLVVSVRSRTSRYQLALLGRDADGAWSVEAMPDEADHDQIPDGAGPLAASDDFFTFVLPEPGTASVGWTGGGTRGFRVVEPGTAPFPESRPDVAVAVATGVDGRLVVAGSTGPFRKPNDIIGYDPRLWSTVGDRLDAVSDLPPVVSGIIDLRRGDGDAVVILAGASGQTGLAEEASLGQAPTTQQESTDLNDLWVGELRDGVVTERARFGGPGEQTAERLSKVGGTWFVGGNERVRVDTVERQAALWSSTDLVDWTRLPGDWGRGTVAQVCAAGDRHVAVGATQGEDFVSRTAVWERGTDGSWAGATAALGLPAESGTFTGCASGEREALLLALVDMRPRLFRLGTSGPAEEVDLGLPASVGVVGVEQGPDGFVMVGTDARGLTTRGVVWTSSDGLEWARHDQPDEMLGNDFVTVAGFGLDGRRLVINGQQGSVGVVWIVDDPFALPAT